MFNYFTQSRFFEKKGFLLRRALPFLGRHYNSLNKINYRTLSEKDIPNIAPLISEAQVALDQLTKAANAKPEQNKIPKKLWLYWNQPLELAPDVVEQSVASWRKQNPDYEVTYLCDETLEQQLGFNFNAVFRLATVNLNVALKADILRLYLLSSYGGVWADTTTFCLAPLNTWLPSVCVDTNLFTFRHPENRSRPIEVWFIAAPKSSAIIQHVYQNFLKHVFRARVSTLYVSNKIKKIGLKDSSESPFLLDTLKKAEEKGFMPYFSFGYLFNEALNQSNTTHTWQQLQLATNNHAVNNDDFEKFKQSLVSKQTYKKDYQESALYKARRAHLQKLLDG